MHDATHHRTLPGGSHSASSIRARTWPGLGENINGDKLTLEIGFDANAWMDKDLM